METVGSRVVGWHTIRILAEQRTGQWHNANTGPFWQTSGKGQRDVVRLEDLLSGAKLVVPEKSKLTRSRTAEDTHWIDEKVRKCVAAALWDM